MINLNNLMIIHYHWYTYIPNMVMNGESNGSWPMSQAPRFGVTDPISLGMPTEAIFAAANQTTIFVWEGWNTKFLYGGFRVWIQLILLSWLNFVWSIFWWWLVDVSCVYGSQGVYTAVEFLGIFCVNLVWQIPWRACLQLGVWISVLATGRKMVRSLEPNSPFQSWKFHLQKAYGKCRLKNCKVVSTWCFKDFLCPNNPQYMSHSHYLKVQIQWFMKHHFPH